MNTNASQKNVENIPLQSTIGEYWVFMTEKFIIFTKNKMGSRYLGSWSGHAIRNNENEKIWSGIVCFDFAYNVLEEYTSQDRASGYTTDDFLKEMKLVSDKKSLKEIVFIYRDPLQRTISGMVQEFTSGIGPSNQKYVPPHLITIGMLFNKYDLKKYLRIFRNPNYIKNFNLQLIEPDDVKNFLEFIINWISVVLEFGILNTSHTDKFCEPYYQMMKTWDSNKIILINLDYENKDTLKLFLKNLLDFKFENNKLEVLNRQTNGNMVNFLLNMQDYLEPEICGLSKESIEELQYIMADYQEIKKDIEGQISLEKHYYNILSNMHDNNYHTMYANSYHTKENNM